MFAKCLKANDKGLHLPKNKQEIQKTVNPDFW
jgi:hypothetical protein